MKYIVHYSPFCLKYRHHQTVPVGLLKGDEEVKVEAMDNLVEKM